MTKILAIGNSFSQDATAYLHGISQKIGMETKISNIHIGGCSLFSHWENIQNDACRYNYSLNGLETGRMVSIKEMLMEDNWDFVTLQQASPDSGLIETYFPYAAYISEYIQNFLPDATQLIHQTWAYETDSSHSAFPRYENDQIFMYHALKSAYQKASEILGLRLIPCGDVIQKLRNTRQFDYSAGGQSLCRDGFHMHMIYGRYAVAATWFESILNGNILQNVYIPPGAKDADLNMIELIKQTVHQVCAG